MTAAALWGLRRRGAREVTVATARAPRDGLVPHASRVLTADDRAVIRGIRSRRLEDRFLALCRRERLPLPRLNTHLGVGLDRLVEADALFARERVIVELDGGATHDTTGRVPRRPPATSPSASPGI